MGTNPDEEMERDFQIAGKAMLYFLGFLLRFKERDGRWVWGFGFFIYLEF